MVTRRSLKSRLKKSQATYHGLMVRPKSRVLASLHRKRSAVSNWRRPISLHALAMGNLGTEHETHMANMKHSNEEWLTPQEASDRYKITLDHMAHMRSEGVGPAFYKLGASKTSPIRYKVSDWESWL